MFRHVLVTGGAGFIGSHTVDRLLHLGYRVRVFDNLDPQVHGGRQTPPDYLSPEAEFVRGDMRDRDAVRRALDGIDAVIHDAGAVGVGQSQYQVDHYIDVNVRGTAVLLDVLVNDKTSVERVLVASSMSIYGEGLYRRPSDGALRTPALRPDEQLARKDFEMRDPETGEALEPLPTPESKPLFCTSVYAQSKKDQEEYCLIVGRAHRIPTVACRFFNVYGPRQSLSNPYTGVAAIFSSRIKNDAPPLIYEDGSQMRDFTSVHDLVRGKVELLENPKADGVAVNLGTGRPTSILEIARLLARLYGRPHLEPEVLRQSRSGDTRHCFGDIALARSFGFEPRVSLEEGLRELVAWGETAEADDRVAQAHEELRRKGLVRE
ncbi:MAG: SDR family NAD(P)-dependent oxidoreductase [Candidatus Sumerlaeia bacterium]|nr:SDR family NAD(P)-dependent oxidoreductase [Candidatus Sumerlaeia bacterium]